MLTTPALALVAWIAVLPAQNGGGELRDRVSGVVRDRAGEPWAGALVTLLWCPPDPSPGNLRPPVSSTRTSYRGA